MSSTGSGLVAADRLLPTWLRSLILVILLVIILLPVLYIAGASLMPDAEVAAGQLVPRTFRIGNYADIWSTVNLLGGLLNSLLVAGGTAILCALVSAGTGYVLVRFAFRGRATILRILLALQSVPGTLLLLPIFILFSSANLYLNFTVVGTRFGLFITYLTFALPFSTWVIVTYLRGLPISLEEAGMIDGCTPFGVFRRIVLPLSWPGIVVSGIFAFLLGWNDVLFATVLTRPDTETAAIVLQVFGSAQEGGALPLYGQLMASALVCAAPVVILYLAFQRYLVGGLTAGGVK